MLAASQRQALHRGGIGQLGKGDRQGHHRKSPIARPSGHIGPAARPLRRFRRFALHGQPLFCLHRTRRRPHPGLGTVLQGSRHEPVSLAPGTR